MTKTTTTTTTTTMPELTRHRPRSSSRYRSFLLPVMVPVMAAVVMYQLDPLNPAEYPLHELTQSPAYAPLRNTRMLEGAERIGVDQLLGPEDLAYDSGLGVLYATCVDGWIKRVTVNESLSDSVVENWVNTGGRPLGIVLGNNGDVIVADADKGLLRVTSDGQIEWLTKEADGIEFKLTDGIDIAKDGTIYFTDASSKYNIKEHLFDLLEGRPYGRLLSYNPATKKTKVLVRDLYFANGVAVSPDQRSVIFCETPLEWCRRYHIKGGKKGSIDKFINVPGSPDNIHYDGHGGYWIGLATGVNDGWHLARRYPLIRKISAILERHGWLPNIGKDGGVLSVDLEGNPVALYSDPALYLITAGIKIGDHLYCGSILNSFILRLNATRYPAVVTT